MAEEKQSMSVEVILTSDHVSSLRRGGALETPRTDDARVLRDSLTIPANETEARRLGLAGKLVVRQGESQTILRAIGALYYTGFAVDRGNGNALDDLVTKVKAAERSLRQQEWHASAKLPLYVQLAPSGKWAYVGDIPTELGQEVPADTAAVLGQRAYKAEDGAVMMRKFPVFKTMGEALGHARRFGYEPKVTDEDRKVAEWQGVTAYLVPARIEVPTGGNGRQKLGYRWVDGYRVVTPAGEPGEPLRKSEAKELCRECGWKAEVVRSVEEAREKLGQTVRVTVRGHVYDVKGHIEEADRSVGIMSDSFWPEEARAVDQSSPELPFDSLTDKEIEEIDRAFWEAQPPEQCDPLDEEQEPDLEVSR